MKKGEKRKQELIDQFFSGNDFQGNGIDMSLKNDVGLWSDLAWAWINSI